LLAIGQAGALMLYMACHIRSHRVLIYPLLLLLTLSIALAHDILLHTKLALYFPQVLGLGPIHTYLIGPISLMIGYKLLKPKGKLSKLNLLHFLPFAVHIWTRLPTLLLNSSDKLGIIQDYFENTPQIMSPEFNIENIGQFFIFHGHRFAYFAYIIYFLGHKHHELKHAVKSRLHFTLLLRRLVIVYCVIWGLVRILVFVPTVGDFVLSSSNIINSMGLSLVVAVVANFCFNFPIGEIFSSKSTQKYQKTNLGEDLNSTIYHEIEACVSRKEVFSDPDVKLSDIARLTGFKNHQISQAISLSKYPTFNSLLNHFRIEEFKRLVTDGQNSETELLQLAYSAGFNSKATFNRVFKQQTGLTPRQFKHSL